VINLRPVPLYEYECEACGHHLEAQQRLADDPLTKCPECGKNKLQKLISATAFHLKGGGWYKDLYSSQKPGSGGDSEGSGGSSPASDTSETKTEKAETKAEPKTAEKKPDKKKGGSGSSSGGSSGGGSASKKPAKGGSAASAST
jgi:putative FmdB family regulatory protein